MANAFTDPPRPRIRTNVQAADDLAAKRAENPSPYAAIQDAEAKVNALAAWADEHDPQPPRWRRRARRDWRLRWGVMP